MDNLQHEFMNISYTMIIFTGSYNNGSGIHTLI